jgi:hypothetical protein
LHAKNPFEISASDNDVRNRAKNNHRQRPQPARVEKQSPAYLARAVFSAIRLLHELEKWK